MGGLTLPQKRLRIPGSGPLRNQKILSGYYGQSGPGSRQDPHPFPIHPVGETRNSGPATRHSDAETCFRLPCRRGPRINSYLKCRLSRLYRKHPLCQVDDRTVPELVGMEGRKTLACPSLCSRGETPSAGKAIRPPRFGSLENLVQSEAGKSPSE